MDERLAELEKRLEDLEDSRFLYRRRRYSRTRIRIRSNPISTSFEAKYLQIMQELLDTLRAFNTPKGPGPEGVDAEFLSTPPTLDTGGAMPLSKVFLDELSALLNKHSLESWSNTPDFVLAQYLCQCLETFNNSIRWRERARGR